MADQPHVLNRVSSGSWVVLLLAGTVVRSGFGVYRATGPLVEFADSFPAVTGSSYKLYSVLAPATAALTSATTSNRWTILHLVLIVGVLGATLGWAARRIPPTTRRPLVLLIAGSATPTVLLQHVGHYDVYAFAAGLLLVMPSLWAAVVGGVMFGLTSVEQGVAAIAALCFVFLGLGRSVPRRLAGAATAVAMAGGATRVWLMSHDVVPRSDLFLERLARSLEGVARGGTVAIWSWYGLAWILVIAVMCLTLRDDVARWRIVCLVAGLLVVPAVATVVTLDGTRVFAVIAWPALLLGAQWLGQRQDVEQVMSRGGPRLDALLGGVLALWLVTPAYITWKGGDVLLPWADAPW